MDTKCPNYGHWDIEHNDITLIILGVVLIT